MYELDGDGRIDLYVYNEATAWTLSSRELIEAAPLDADDPEAWDRAFDEGRLIAHELVQDDAFHVRVVLGELRPDEDQAWVGRSRWWLQVPDGVLVLAAGGEFSWGWAEDMLDDDYIQMVQVPPGDYEVTVLTTFHGVNGAWLLDHERGERDTARWWRESRPDEEFPDWLKLAVLNGAAHDPGHEHEWEWPYARYERLARSVESSPPLDWIVQLEPLRQRPTDRPELEEGMLRAHELRAPERVPLAVIAAPVNTLPPDRRDRPEPADVFGRVGDIEAVEIAGGPVEVPARDAYLLARLGWFANQDVDVEVLVDGEVGEWVERHIDPDEVTIRTAPDGRLRLGFPPAQTVHDVEAYLRWHADAFADLPDGARVDVITAAEGTSAGRMGFSGTTRGPVLEVWGSWPGVDAATLRDALALAREAEHDTVDARDEREVDAVRARWKGEGLQRITPLEVDGLTLGHDEGGRFTLRVAAALFAVRFGDTWECVEPEDPLAELGLDLEDELPFFESEDWPTGGPVHTDPDSGREYLAVFSSQLPETVRQATEPVLDAFEEAGAVRVGDTVCDVNLSLLIRAVADERARWYGVLMVAPFGEAVTEIYTRFADGSSLTTTTNPFGGLGGSEKGIFRNPQPPGSSVADLVTAHAEAIDAHAAERATEVVVIRQNLVGLAQALEEFLTRQFSP